MNCVEMVLGGVEVASGDVGLIAALLLRIPTASALASQTSNLSVGMKSRADILLEFYAEKWCAPSFESGGWCEYIFRRRKMSRRRRAR
jgi:hypothetical protein